MEMKVYLPSLGDENDAVQGGTVTQWMIALEEAVEEGGDLLEITTDKAAFVVPSSASGKLKKQCVHAGDKVEVGQLLAILEA